MDGFAFDVSSRLAREQIARQVAASSTYRRQQQQQQSRVCKPMSTGSSPQNLARRREAAGARMYSSPSDAANSARRRAATSATGRPLSMNIDYRSSGWQGNYSAFSIHDQQASRHSMYEVNNQLGQYQTVAMNGLPTPMTHPELNNMPVDQCFSLDSSPTFPSDYMHLPASDAWQMKVSHVGQVMTPISNNQQAAHAAYPLDYVQSPFAIYQQMLQASASVIGMQTAVQTAPPTPDLFPDQVAEEESEEEDDGPELVGMGLYDTAPGNGGVGALNGGSPTGKTLKLCDAWTPPEDTKSEDGDDDEDEDDEDEDDEEEEEEEQDEEEEDDDVEAATMGATALAGLTGGSWGMTMSQAAWV